MRLSFVKNEMLPRTFGKMSASEQEKIKMKTRKIKFTTMLSATLFVMAAFLWLAPVVARAQIILKPGEIIYSRTFTPFDLNCSTTSVWAVGQDGSNDRLLFANANHPRISPNGRFIMFNRGTFVGFCAPFSGTEIWTRELATGRESFIAIASTGALHFSSFFTPETNRADSQIIFDSSGSVCRINMDGTNRVCNVMGLGGINNFAYPTVRGDDYLGIVSNLTTQGQGIDGFYTFNYNLTNPVKMPNTDRFDRSPTWSNDGQTIAYGLHTINRSNPYFFSELFKINPDGSNKTQLTFVNPPNAEGFSHGMAWAANEFIYNAAKINGVAGIYKIATDGSGNMSQIPTTAGNAPDWVGGIVPVYSEQQVALFGGGLTSGGIFSVLSTIGQGFAGQNSSGGTFNVRSGFWDYPASAAPSSNGILTFSSAAYSVGESGGAATVTVTRTAGSDGAVSVSYATSNGTATAGGDYTAASGTLNWDAGESVSKTFTVPILDDTILEGNETVNLILSNPTGGATLGTPNTATLTIIDNETCSYSISPTSQTIAATGGNANTSVTAASGCAWTAASNAAWLTITSGTSGTGNGIVNYSAAANSGAARTGTLTIAGQTLTVSQSSGSTTTPISVSIPTNLSASQNTTLNVPVNLSDTTGRGITSFDFRLTYDPAILTPLATPFDTVGTLSGAFEINVSNPSAGTLIVSGFGTAPLAGAGALLNFKFNTVGAAASCSALGLTNFGFNEGNPSSTITGGQACIALLTVSGAVTYAITTTAVPGVVLTAAGTPAVASAATNAGGTYTLNGFGTGSYTVTPSKTGDTNNALTSFDASQISKHLVQTVTLTPQQLAAADVSGNGTITSFDASLIAQTVLGIPNAGNAGTWRFTPVSRTYSNITVNHTSQDYTAILIGEVSGNWTPPNNFAEPEQVPSGAIPVSLPMRNVGVNSDFTAPVFVGDVTGLEISSFDFEVLYDPLVIEPHVRAVANADTMSSEFIVGANVIAPGKLRVSGFSSTNLAGSGILVNLNFRAAGETGASSDLNWNNFMFNEGRPVITRTNGRVSANALARRTPLDFDGDGRTDISVFRPSDRVWYLNQSTAGFSATQFGLSSDIITPADFDGDAKTDIGVWRGDPGNPDRSMFYYIRSSDNTFRFEQFGKDGDQPLVGDWDGDGKADPAVYREGVGGGQSFFYYRPSSQPGVDFITIHWGVTGDRPMHGDFDGDGKLDAAVFRSSDRIWYISQSSNGESRYENWGLASDTFVPADYDGDSKTDLAVFRPSTGFWHIRNSLTLTHTAFPFGVATDIPAPGDYDGDGRADLSVFRPSDGNWYRLNSSNVAFHAFRFGRDGDKPAPSAFY